MKVRLITNKNGMKELSKIIISLHGNSISGDLVAGGLKTTLAFVVKGSSFSPKLSMVIPNAHRAMTSMVNALNCLCRT
jgi:hypothetical protein